MTITTQHTRPTPTPAVGVGRVLLVGTYDLGHQPFGLASPAAWLRAAGYDVDVLDLSRCPLDADLVAGAAIVAFHIPMHTATRLAIDAAASGPRARPGRADLLLRPLRPGQRRPPGRGRCRRRDLRRVRGRAGPLCQRDPRLTDPRRPPTVADRPARVQGPRPRRPARAGELRPTRDRRSSGASSATPRPPAAAGTCAGTARSPRSTADASGSSARTSCSPTSRPRSRPAPSTSPSATPTSSTPPRTRIRVVEALHERWPRPDLRRHHQGRAPPPARAPAADARSHRLPVRHQRGRVHRRRRAGDLRQGPHPRGLRRRRWPPAARRAGHEPDVRRLPSVADPRAACWRPSRCSTPSTSSTRSHPFN